MCLQVADLRLKLATVQSKNIVLSNREIRLLRYIDVEQDDEERLILKMMTIILMMNKLDIATDKFNS